MNQLCRKHQLTVMLFITIHDLRDPLLFNHEFKSLYSVIDHVSARLEYFFFVFFGALLLSGLPECLALVHTLCFFFKLHP